MRFRLLVILALFAASAGAHNVSDELTSSSTDATTANPRSGAVSDQLNASFDLNDEWTVSAGASLTAEGKTAALSRGAFGTSGGLVTSFSVGVDWQANDSWGIGLSFDYSPENTQFAGTQVLVNAGGNQADALLRSKSLQAEGGLEVTYDTAGESDLEWSFGGGVTTTHLDTDQAITRVRTSNGAAATPQQIKDYCASHKCPRALLDALRVQTGVTLDSQRLSATATAILWKDTDLTLSGDYYVYDQDPTQVGYYSVARIGQIGNGLNIAPVQFSVRPEVLHRFGGFSVKLWVQAGQYVSGAGQGTTSAGLKLQYKFTKTFKMWATGSVEHDFDEGGNETKSNSISVGAGYRF
jgi:hypothetical protein